MAIDKRFSVLQFEAYLLRCQEYAEEQVYRALAYLAEECVNRIRDRSAEDSWIDHTGNLRSSIGYIITRNGRLVTQGGFLPTNAPESNGSEGQQKGQGYAETIVSRFADSPLALVIVAGMEYAVYVEAIDNKDVLASAELWARSEWKRREPVLKAKIEKGWERIARQMGFK